MTPKSNPLRGAVPIPSPTPEAQEVIDKTQDPQLPDWFDKPYKHPDFIDSACDDAEAVIGWKCTYIDLLKKLIKELAARPSPASPAPQGPPISVHLTMDPQASPETHKALGAAIVGAIEVARAENAKRAAPGADTREAAPLSGEWRHNAGYLCCGTLRIMRADWDTDAAPEFRQEVMDWLVGRLNAPALAPVASPPALTALIEAAKAARDMMAEMPQPYHPDEWCRVYNGLCGALVDIAANMKEGAK